MEAKVLSPKDGYQINAGVLAEISRERIRIARPLESFQKPNVEAYVITYSVSGTNVAPWSIPASYTGRIENVFLPWWTLTQTAVVETETLEQRFYKQAEKWQSETEHLSSPSQMLMHPSYQAVLGMARENERTVIRLMLCDLRDHRRMWFWALSYLTKENPVNSTDAGRLDKMIKSWVDWGTQRGLL